jgi:hypothetical protein
MLGFVAPTVTLEKGERTLGHESTAYESTVYKITVYQITADEIVDDDLPPDHDCGSGAKLESTSFLKNAGRTRQ